MPAPHSNRGARGAEKNLLRDRIDNLLLVQKAKDLNINVDSDMAKQMARSRRNPGLPIPTSFTTGCRNKPACRSKTSRTT